MHENEAEYQVHHNINQTGLHRPFAHAFQRQKRRQLCAQHKRHYTDRLSYHIDIEDLSGFRIVCKHARQVEGSHKRDDECDRQGQPGSDQKIHGKDVLYLIDPVLTQIFAAYDRAASRQNGGDR